VAITSQRLQLWDPRHQAVQDTPLYQTAAFKVRASVRKLSHFDKQAQPCQQTHFWAACCHTRPARAWPALTTCTPLAWIPTHKQRQQLSTLFTMPKEIWAAASPPRATESSANWWEHRGRRDIR